MLKKIRENKRTIGGLAIVGTAVAGGYAAMLLVWRFFMKGAEFLIKKFKLY